MLSLRRRIGPVVAVLLGAPISAELIQAYLGSTGDALKIAVAAVFLAPLYGGAVLLIRELAVRTGRGWGCRLLLGAAFGTAMTGLIDLSLFGAERPDIAYWADYRAPTEIDALGLSAAPALVWVSGHVVMSVGVPLALLEGATPGHRGRPLLGRIGIPVLIALWAAVAAAVFTDGQRIYGYTPSPGQAGGVLAVVALLVFAALTRLGNPVPPTRGIAGIRTSALLAGGFVFKVALDVIPATWLGLALTTALLASAAALIGWLARHRAWGPGEIAAVAAGILLAAAALGFTNPVPDAASPTAKYLQNAVLLAACIILVTRVLRRGRRGGKQAESRDGPRQPQLLYPMRTDAAYSRPASLARAIRAGSWRGHHVRLGPWLGQSRQHPEFGGSSSPPTLSDHLDAGRAR